MCPPFSEHFHVGGLLGDLVHCDDHNEVDHIGKQTDGSCIGEHALTKTYIVNIGADQLGNRNIAGGLQQQNLGRAAGKQTAAVHDQHHHGGGDQGGDIDVADLLPDAGAVQLRRLVQSRVNAGQGGYEQNTAEVVYATALFCDILSKNQKQLFLFRYSYLNM